MLALREARGFALSLGEVEQYVRRVYPHVASTVPVTDSVKLLEWRSALESELKQRPDLCELRVAVGGDVWALSAAAAQQEMRAQEAVKAQEAAKAQQKQQKQQAQQARKAQKMQQAQQALQALQAQEGAPAANQPQLNMQQPQQYHGQPPPSHAPHLPSDHQQPMPPPPKEPNP